MFAPEPTHEAAWSAMPPWLNLLMIPGRPPCCCISCSATSASGLCPCALPPNTFPSRPSSNPMLCLPHERAVVQNYTRRASRVVSPLPQRNVFGLHGRGLRPPRLPPSVHRREGRRAELVRVEHIPDQRAT